ncbi:MAG: CRISPR-associated protein Cmr4 [Clostridiales bacterium]|jgi:CRISPR-associated protein Cmr4|nr:CRISPR-associated protein Cmr4 [Clostridiales bacterium]MDN5282462.1 CRISPR-associated protein Cmr4 [Candidatus Ozemobacter sp.]
MFEKKSLVFYYCTTPLHMGAGTSVGAIDNPIQREIHSNHPMIAGSGLKGAVRHHLNKLWNKEEIVPLFGSEPGLGDLTAGAVSFTDANLLAFPVRSVKNTFVYVTCPYSLARIKRMATLAGLKFDWNVSEIQPNTGASNAALADGKLCLEAFEFSVKEDEDVGGIAEWLADHCLPQGEDNDFFREKITSDFFVLDDDSFNYFVKQATVVEPHVRIDDATGTAADGALFYTENLPPESILAGIVLASVERKKGEGMSAEVCLDKTLFAEKGISGKLVQMGGDSTTGRGLVLINAVKGA